MHSIYIERRLSNGQELLTWAKAEGFRYLLRPADLHVTVALAQSDLTVGAPEADLGYLLVEGGVRFITRLNHDVIALEFAAPQLRVRRQDLVRSGLIVQGSVRPHVTFAFQPSIDRHQPSAYAGLLSFSHEVVRSDTFASLRSSPLSSKIAR